MADRRHIKEVEGQAALFALGALPPGEAGRFQQRLKSGCPICGGMLREAEEAITAISLSVPVAAPPPGLRARLLDRIGAGNRPAGRPAADLTVVRSDDTAWQTSPVPGVDVRALYGQKTMLVRMAPKTWYPAHHHDAAEQCLVLEGSVSSDGVTVKVGDFTYMPSGSHHQPLYSESGCVLLIAYT